MPVNRQTHGGQANQPESAADTADRISGALQPERQDDEVDRAGCEQDQRKAERNALDPGFCDRVHVGIIRRF
jgi:hypothetical protein